MWVGGLVGGWLEVEVWGWCGWVGWRWEGAMGDGCVGRRRENLVLAIEDLICVWPHALVPLRGSSCCCELDACRLAQNFV